VPKLTVKVSRKGKARTEWFRGNLGKLVEATKVGEDAGGNGYNKLEHAAEWLNDQIDIPYVPDFLEEMIFKWAITGLVELAKRFWGDKDWFAMLCRTIDMEELLED
jgi:hypothetical protein